MKLDDLNLDLVEIMDIGDQVICDICNEDYTHNNIDQGGILFGSKAVCPKCTPKLEDSAKKYNEEDYITDRCPARMTFREWCLQLRNGNNLVSVYTWD